MNLSKSVERFTLEELTDPYGVGSPMYGHLSVFEDEKSSGVATRRRIIETLPTYTMYSTGCVSHSGTVYIVGDSNFDYHKGAVVRVKYPAIPCDAEFKIASILQILTNTVTTRVSYISISQDKNAVADSETSFATTMYTAFMPSFESIGKRDILISGSLYFRVKSDPWVDGAGFKNVSAVLLSSPLTSLTFTRISGYDPITDTIVNGAAYPNTPVFIEDAYYSYENNSERYQQLKPGDKNITIKPSVTPKSGDIIGSYKALTIDSLTDGTFSCHCRKV